MNCIGDLLKCDKNYIFTQFVEGDWFIRSNKFILQWNWQKKLSVLSRFGQPHSSTKRIMKKNITEIQWKETKCSTKKIYLWHWNENRCNGTKNALVAFPLVTYFPLFLIFTLALGK